MNKVKEIVFWTSGGASVRRQDGKQRFYHVTSASYARLATGILPTSKSQHMYKTFTAYRFS